MKAISLIALCLALGSTSAQAADPEVRNMLAAKFKVAATTALKDGTIGLILQKEQYVYFCTMNHTGAKLETKQCVAVE